MNFELTREQQALQKAAIEFARGELNIDMIERDAQQVFWHDGWKRCAAFGVQGMPIPKDEGCREAGPITTVAEIERLGYGGSDHGLLFLINARMGTNSIPLLKYGTTEQKKKYLPGLCDGTLMGANGTSDPSRRESKSHRPRVFSANQIAREAGSQRFTGGSTPTGQIYELWHFTLMSH